MTQTRSINWYSALLININVTIGAGIFINLVPLYTQAGTGSFFPYILAGLLMFPVILTVGALTRRHPESGGLFVFSKNYTSRFAGFLSSWSYFIGKSVSIALLSHVCMGGVAEIFPVLQVLPVVVRDILAIFTFIGLNFAGLSLGGRAQKLFIVAKFIPILFVVSALASRASQLSFNASISLGQTIDLLPMVAFAMVGFEAITAIAHLIERPEKTIMPIMVGAFLSVITILVVVQSGVGFLLADSQVVANPPLTALAQYYFPGLGAGAEIFKWCFYTSVFGGAFGMLTSNCWNFFTLASEGFFPAKSFLTSKTERNVPWVSMLIEGVVASLIITISSDQVPLQNFALMGIVTAFCTAVIAALRAHFVHGVRLIHPAIMCAAAFSTSYFIFLAARKIYFFGMSIPVFALYLSGIIGAYFWGRLSDKIAS